ncbi:hypothetical protein GGX14DRAFT_176742 [Mycena pura]|uniref:DNA mismatch repair proteins mutS family domain-containing protein n=1 Tax=Mycena pura TaxID=153505 RepID=A0AAD7E055_9AGAR|nr:hypothetical protein GGX14DRAFT_176742 [Mycena pura]
MHCLADSQMTMILSTFASEMAPSGMILGNHILGRVAAGTDRVSRLVTSQSLVIIDELGRGTSPREGVGISHAIAES